MFSAVESRNNSITMNKKFINIILGATMTTATACAQTHNVYYTSNMKLASETNSSYTLKLQPASNSRYSGVLLDALGQKRCEGEYMMVGKNFLEDGHFKYYHPNGNIESVGEFERGVKVGSWKRFEATGKRKQDRYYPAESASLIRESMHIENANEVKTSSGE